MGATNYAWNPIFDCITEETNDAGAITAEYTHEPKRYGGLISQHRSGATSIYHYDAVGTTRALTDFSQNVTDVAVYAAFGVKVTSVGTTIGPFGYVGALGYYTSPSSDRIHVHARDYRPGLARWMSGDLAGVLAFMEVSCNGYLYVMNNPTNRTQPSDSEEDGPEKQEGEDKCEVEFCATDIDVTKGFAKHMFIRIVRSIGGKPTPWAYRGGPSDQPGTGKSGILPGCLCKGIEFGDYGQVITQHAAYDDKFIDYYRKPKKENCAKMEAKVSCEELHDCYVKILDRINKCCFSYEPLPKEGKKNANSNSVIYWLTERCAPKLGPLGSVLVPSKPFQIALAPGWGIDVPDCVKGDKKGE